MKNVSLSIIKILVLPLILLAKAASLKTTPVRKIIYMLIILIVYGGIWFSAYSWSLLNVYYSLYDIGWIDRTTDVHVIGESMLPTIKDDSFVTLLSPKKYPVQYGDIVSFTNPETGADSYIKRVIGLPGDKLMIKDGSVVLNGKILNEPYILSGLPTYGNTFLNECQSYTVPPDSYIVMGDNRTVSQDSRVLGYIKQTDLDGIIKTHMTPEYDNADSTASESRQSVDPALLIQAINSYRQSHQVAELMPDSALSQTVNLRVNQIRDLNQAGKSYPALTDFMDRQNYTYNLIHEYLAYGYLSADEIVSQIQDISPEKDLFLSSKFTNIAVGEAAIIHGECNTPLTLVVISWPKKPVYDDAITSKWKSEDENTAKLISNIQSLAGNPNINQQVLSQLTDNLIRQSEISSRLFGKMSSGAALNADDTSDIQKYPEISAKSDELIRQLLEKTLVTPVPTPTGKQTTPDTEKVKTDFTGYGQRSIEGGILAQLQSVAVTDSRIELVISLSDFSQRPVSVSPLRFQIHSLAPAESASRTLASINLNPLESQTFTLSFDNPGDPPYRFVYVNNNGNTIDLGYAN